MKMFSRRELARFGAGAVWGLGAAAFGADPSKPAAVHAELAAGNLRFVSGHPRHPHSSLKWLQKAARDGQHPHAIVLCCSDSRVSPEILFDQGLGDLFVVRVAGNVVREDEIGSIEYSVRHLHVPLCVILGHTSCGAVSAVVEDEKLSGELDHLVSPIRSAFAKVKAQDSHRSHDALVTSTVKLHVQESRATLIRTNSFLAESVSAHQLQIESAVYHLETGRVEWL